MDMNIDGMQGLDYDLSELGGFPEVMPAQSDQQRPSPLIQPAEFEAEAWGAPTRKLRSPRSLPVDAATQVRRSELSDWGTHYAANMARASKLKQQKRNVLARANAEYFVFGTGLGGVGNPIGAFGPGGPLATFANHSLLEALQAPPHLKRKLRRLSVADPGAEERRVRPRGSEEAEMARGDAMILEDHDVLAAIGDDVSFPSVLR